MKKIITVLVAVFFAATCSEPNSTVAEETEVMPNQVTADEEIGPDIGNCKKPKVTPINIKFGKHGISVRPLKPEAWRGYVLRFNVIVTGNVDAVVYVGGKESDDIWIVGNNKEDAKKFYVCVDPDLDLGDPPADKTYEYFVRIPGVGFIDPEVIVKK